MLSITTGSSNALIDPTSPPSSVMENDFTLPISATIVAIVALLITISIVSLLFYIIYWKRRGSSLPHLDKHHKESEENSYSSSKNSRESSPKGEDSFNSVYDEIKLKHFSHGNISVEVVDVVNKSWKDGNKIDNQQYSAVYSKVSDQHCDNEEAVSRGSNLTCTQLSKNYEETNDWPKLNDNSSIISNNDDIDKGKSENSEAHTYALVDMKKKKTEDTKIQEICTENYTDSDGGTPPPVPPHTPEMLLNDGDSNTSHNERVSRDH